MHAQSIRFAAIAVLVVAANPSGAATLRVPSEYATINAAIDAAAAGDTVLVAPGVYDQYETRLLPDGIFFSSVAFLKSGVVVFSEAGSGATTLRMDTTVADPVVLRAFGESGVMEVRGFTISGSVPSVSGAQFGFGGKLVLRDCVFVDLGDGVTNSLAVGSVSADVEVYECRFEDLLGPSGGAISQTSGTLLVEDSDFLNCRRGALQTRRSDSFQHEKSLTVRRCRFVGNVRPGDTGGAITVLHYPQVLIEESWFENNEAEGAGAILLTGSPGVHTVRGCTFVGNWGGTGEGAAIQSAGHTTVIERCTFVGNGQAIDWFESGAALTLRGWITNLSNNVFASSTGDQAVGKSGLGSVTSSCNIYFANLLGNTSGFAMDATDLEVDPEFCDAAVLDFTVHETSPCLPGNGHASCTEQIGAWGEGCGTVSVNPSSWGKVKSDFRTESEVGR